MDLSPSAAMAGFAAEVGPEGPVTIGGLGTRGGPVPGVRRVAAPVGIEWIQPDEMTVSVGAGTPVDDLAAALAEVGQRTILPSGGTVGGALADGRSGIRRLGDGPLRDALLQADFVAADGAVVRAGGPTVKNVSGFDLCRLLVGSRGTLGFLGAVILRTTPVRPFGGWYSTEVVDPFPIFQRLHRPVAVLWDGARLWARLEGHPRDVADQAAAAGLLEVDGPPALPIGSRRLVRPSEIVSQHGVFVAELGVGVVHHADPLPVGPSSGSPPSPLSTASSSLHALSTRVKQAFDPSGRLNPGVVIG